MTIEKQLIHNIAIYMRLSKEDGDTEESESISNQRGIIFDFLNKHFIYDNCYEYVDDGISGATFNRPDFQRMIKELKPKKIDLVITKNLARFGRNYIESGEYIEKFFPNNNIRYIAILDSVDNFEDRISNEMAPFKGVFNEMHCKETSKGVKKSKRKRMEEGYYACVVAPYGYLKDSENNGKLIIDSIASKIVRRIFMLTLDGITAKNIADLFNKEEIKTPSEYLKVKGLEDRSKKIWTRSIITRILGNEVYTGKCCRGKSQKNSYKTKKRVYIRREERVVTEDSHEAIISQELFDAVHKTKKYGLKIVKKNEFDTKFINYIYCGKCKEKMERRQQREKVNIYCKSRNETDYLCSNNLLYNYKSIEKILIKNIKREMDNFFKNRNVSFLLTKKYNEIKLNEIEERIKEVNKQLGVIRFKINKVYNDRLMEEITEEEYMTIYTHLNIQRNEKNNKILELEKEKKEILQLSEDISKYNRVKKILTKMEKNEFTTEEIGEFIDSIELSEDNILINYKFKELETKINFS